MNRAQWIRSLTAIVLVCSLLGCGFGQGPVAVDLLGKIRERGKVRCGIDTSNGIFGSFQGLAGPAGYDIDFCSALAIALFGTSEDASKVEFLPVRIYERWSVLRNETVDVVIRTTTTTLGRDTVENVTFTVPNFYDGQGFMVPGDSPIQTLAELDQPGNTYCVTIATTTLVNAEGYFQYATPVPAVDIKSRNADYFAGKCTAVTTDVTSLLPFKRPTDRILPEQISREPLAAMVWEVDPNWTAFVQWVVQGLTAAQYYGVARSNIAQVIGFDDLPLELQRLLGLLPLNLTFVEPNPRWIVDVLAVLGNYQDIYSRQIGAEVPQRGTANDLYSAPDGHGLYYPLVWSPPTEPAYAIPAWHGRLVDIVRQRGYLRCGCHENNLLFGRPVVGPSPGRFDDYAGFDADFCKAIATAIFAAGDPLTFNVNDYVQFLPIVNDRLLPLLAEDIDVLVMQTTATIGRDIANHVAFTDPIFYDGQSFLTRRADNITTLMQLNKPERSYCVRRASTSEQNAAAALPAATAKPYASVPDAAAAFFAHQCDALTADSSALLEFVDPDTTYLFPQVISREPLAIVVSDYDVKFQEIAQWVRHGLVTAENYGVDQAFIAALADPLADEPALLALPSEAQRMLGVKGYNISGLPLQPKFMRYVIAVTGNYAEIYDRWLADSLPRQGTYNDAWSTANGLLFSPPWSGLARIAAPPVTNSTPTTSSAMSVATASLLVCLLFFIVNTIVV